MSNFPPNFWGAAGGQVGAAFGRGADALRKSSIVPGGLARNSYRELQKKAKGRGVKGTGKRVQIEKGIVDKNKAIAKKTGLVLGAAGVGASMFGKEHSKAPDPVYDDYMNTFKIAERNRRLGPMHGPQTYEQARPSHNVPDAPILRLDARLRTNEVQGEVSKINRYTPYIDSGYGPQTYGQAKPEAIYPQLPAGHYPQVPAGYFSDEHTYLNTFKIQERMRGKVNEARQAKDLDAKLRTKEVQGEVENRYKQNPQWSDYSKFPISKTVTRVQTTPPTVTLGKMEVAEDIAGQQNKSVISETSKVPNTTVPEIQGSPLRQGRTSQVTSPTVTSRQITMPSGGGFPHTAGMAGYHLFSGASKAVGTSLLPAELVLSGAGKAVGGLRKFLRGE